MAVREEVLNVHTAVWLNGQRGILATPEDSPGGGDNRRPDVRVQIPAIGVSPLHWRIVEAKVGTDQAAKKAAIAAAERWIGDNHCEAAFALCYPRELASSTNAQQDLLDCNKLSMCDVGAKRVEWKTGNLATLATMIRSSELTGGAKIASYMASGIHKFVDHLPASVGETFSSTLNVPPDKVSGRKKKHSGPTYRNAASIAALLLINTAMLHCKLAARHNRLRTQISDLSVIRQSTSNKPKTIKMALIDDWMKIREVDYAPVMDPALTLLNDIPDLDAHGPLATILEAAEHCAPHLGRGQLDYAGPIYHGLLMSKCDGSFYTNTATAVLLAELALPKDFQEWGDWRQLSQLKVCDPACGTGTLLMATQRAILERFDHATNGMEEANRQKLQLALIEKGLIGLDINLHAIHLAACMLTLATEQTEYRNTQLRRMVHGQAVNADSGNLETHCGSLDILVDEEAVFEGMGVGVSGEQKTAQGDENVSSKSIKELRGAIDLVIMNPPYTRNQVRNDHLDKEMESLVQDRERVIADGTADTMHRAAIDNTAVSTYFIPIADILNRKTNGRLAMVRAFAFCTGTSGVAERELLLKRYHVEAVITSHDNDNISFSGNTNIHETLIIGQRQGGDSGNEETAFISLKQNPDSVVEAEMLALSVREVLEKKGTTLAPFGTVSWCKRQDLEDGGWSRAAFLNQELAVDHKKCLLDNHLLSPLHRYIRIAVGARDARGAWRQQKMGGGGGGRYRGAWTHEPDERQTIESGPNRYLIVKPDQQPRADELWSRRAHLLIPHRLDPSRCRVSAIYSPEATVGSAWVAMRVRSTQNQEMCAKAYAVWMNSTAGFLSLLSIRSRKLTYGTFSNELLGQLPVPSDRLDILYQCYEKVASQKLDLFSRLNSDLVRQEIDDAVAKCVPNIAQHLPKWRELIASEPSVHGRKRKDEVKELLR